MTTAPERVRWTRAGTGFPVAPTADEQPAPVPTRPRPDGAPYATPRVRAEARARGVDLPAVSAGTRVRLADLPDRSDLLDGAARVEVPPNAAGEVDPHVTAVEAAGASEVSGSALLDAVDTGEADRPAAMAAAAADLYVAAVEVDVTGIRRALGGRAGTAAFTAVLARVVAGRLARRGAGPVPALGLRVGGSDDVVVLPDAHHLSLAGLLRGVGAGPDGGAPDLVLTHAPDLAWELAPPPAGAAASLTAGAVRREVRVVEVDGTESIAVRAVLQLTLGHDARMRRAEAVDLLVGIRADLESFDPAKLAELPPG